MPRTTVAALQTVVETLALKVENLENTVYEQAEHATATERSFLARMEEDASIITELRKRVMQLEREVNFLHGSSQLAPQPPQQSYNDRAAKIRAAQQEARKAAMKGHKTVYVQA